MMPFSFTRILEDIPEYPSACSAVILAMNNGYIPKNVKTRDALEYGLRKLERRLAWITADEPRPVERRTVTQESTVIELINAGVQKELIPEEMSYLSLIPRGKGKGKEESIEA